MQFLPMADQVNAGNEISIADGDIVELADLENDVPTGEVCCGGPPPPRSIPFERPGYQLEHFVRAFVKAGGSDIPLVKTHFELKDYVGTFKARVGSFRDDYKVAPGLYGVGTPDADSPVIVTANYKLSFDSVRKVLDDHDCWLLILDTCGINVWCAAGKQTFSTDEIIRQVEAANLADRVNHRILIVPQLGATGVAAHQVKLRCGFRVRYGPVKAQDLPAFLAKGMEATAEMRAVTFTLWERFVLIPVEFYLFGKKIWWIFPALFLLSGLNMELFSLSQSVQRGVYSSMAVIAGGLLGAMAVPLLLPWIPGRSFAFKGAIIGLLGSLLLVLLMSSAAIIDKISIVLTVTSISSYLGMNFTGSTPYTSPSGVEKEMKVAIPLQAVGLAVSLVMWLVGPFA